MCGYWCMTRVIEYIARRTGIVQTTETLTRKFIIASFIFNNAAVILAVIPSDENYHLRTPVHIPSTPEYLSQALISERLLASQVSPYTCLNSPKKRVSDNQHFF